MYEFSIVTLSLFTPDGSLYYLKVNATIATKHRNLQATEEIQSIEEFSSNARKVIVIDGMPIVYKINFANSQTSDCDDFTRFTDIITNETED